MYNFFKDSSQKRQLINNESKWCGLSEKVDLKSWFISIIINSINFNILEKDKLKKLDFIIFFNIICQYNIINIY